MKRFLIISLLPLSLIGCATETSSVVQVQKVASAYQPYNGARLVVSVGKFDNRSNYMRGVFSDGEDRLGSQAQTILVTGLQQSHRFNVLSRTILSELKQEAGFKKQQQVIKGADFVITGDVMALLSKEIGQIDLAKRYLAEEKRLFPESSDYIDFLVEKKKK